jgi:ribosome biogenesis GTPase / thiamine phosphate phosphatase
VGFDDRDLRLLGWDSRFTGEAGRLSAEGLTVARVIAVDRDQCHLSDGRDEFRATLAGRFVYLLESAEEFPCVGDWVGIDRQSPDGMGVIKTLIPRSTCLRRRSAGGPIGYQMIAANVDVAIVVQSCHYDFSVRRLERYLVMVRDGGVLPAIVLTKTDLVTADVLADQIGQIRASGIDAPIVALSNVTRGGVDELGSILAAGKTYCFVGSSGVGKSTIINTLVGKEVLDTRLVSATGEGRHTTVRRELIRLDSGAMVIDNPGMREFGVLGASEGLEGGFADIEALGAGCRYRDCTHTSEPACAVRAAVENGVLDVEHYDSFLKLRRESAFHQLSYAERRRRDQAVGRFLKSAKKDLDIE